MSDRDIKGSSTFTTYDELGALYDEAWYAINGDPSVRAARLYFDYLWRFIQPQSVLDIGCGRGEWLKACEEKGIRRLVGFDGHWNHQDRMISKSIRFEAVDLNQPFPSDERFDLAMTLEVAEHLEPQSAKNFTQSLAAMSDLLLFSAAIPNQGGLHHINEQPHSYWAKLLGQIRFVPFDILRPVFWSDDRIPFWYRQNTFLYAKKDTASFDELIAQGLAPMPHIGFMDCVHPALYSSKIDQIDKLKRR
jgi:SAM-dependent methyltransferase